MTRCGTLVATHQLESVLPALASIGLLIIEVADDIKKKHKNRAVISRPHIEQLLASVDKGRTRVSPRTPTPVNFDQLGDLAKEMLLDKNLELSKVRPFFWSLVEAYVDRFQVYPFDMVKALLFYLELHELPEDQLRELIIKLDDIYKQQHGKPVRKSISKAEDISPLDKEMAELRESLKYAAMVAEIEQVED